MRTITLPIIGRVQIGKAEEAPTPSTKKIEKRIDTLLGGFLDFASSKLSNDKSISTKLLEANKGWVYRNNDAIAQEVSKIEFELYTIGLSNGEIVYNEIESHPLLDLLDKPNAETTKTDFIYTLQSHKKLTGDAFWLKVRKNNKIVALRSLPPDKIILNISPPTPENPAVIDSYLYQDVINGEKIEITYAVKDIIHFKKPNPSNVFRGIGAVEALAETIDLDNLTTATTKSFFMNGAITNFVLTTEGRLQDDQLKRLQAEMKASYSGTNNAYKTMILGGGMKPVDISYSNKDQEFLGQLEWYRDKIMYGFGNTKASLGMIDDVNRASHEGSIIEWQRNTVKPDMEAIVNALNEYLVPEFGDNLVLGFCDPVPEDRADDISEVRDLYPIGVMTLNEARELADLEPLTEGGDDFYTTATPQEDTTDQADNNDGAEDDSQA